MSAPLSTSAEAELSPAWADLLILHERDLSAAGAAARTIAAYRRDLRQFSVWSDAAGSEPLSVRHRDVRRYAASLSAAGSSPATVARKLAAIRGLYAFLLRTGRITQNPADLVSAPKAKAKLPRVLTSMQMSEILDSAPARTALELRDRAMIELAYSCGLRSEEVITLNVGSLDFDSEQLSGDRQGFQAPATSGRRAGPAGGRGLPSARPAVTGRRHRPNPPCSSPATAGGCRRRTSGPPTLDQGPRRSHGERDLTSRPAPFLRYPPARGWG